MARSLVLGALPLLILAGCATTGGAAYSAEERARCERMEKDMGTGTVHDHSSHKGMGMNAMNISHERCQRLMAEPSN